MMFTGFFEGWVAFYPAYESWARGNVGAALDEVDRQTGSIEMLPRVDQDRHRRKAGSLYLPGWIAYRSNESGRSEVYVRDFAPDQVPAYGTERVQVTVDGGDKPRWSRDGTEIFFLSGDGTLMAAAVRPGRPFEVDAPVSLFQINPVSYVPYDVTSDGHFIVNNLLDTGGSAVAPMVVILNWLSGVSR